MITLEWLADVGLRATAVVVLAALFVRTVSRNPAALRHLAWTTASAIVASVAVTLSCSGVLPQRTTAAGVSAGRPVAPGTLLVDIGGGSTELVLASAVGGPASTSLDVGCVRLTERFLVSDPPSAAELDDAAAQVRALLPAWEPSAAIGVAGTVTTLAMLDLGDRKYDPARTHRHRIARASVER